jgi:hypothetical protein
MKRWENCLEKWLNPNLGAMPVTDINNRTLNELVSKMTDARLSPQTLHTYIKTVKMVVTSAVNDDGEELSLREWNSAFIDLPEIAGQRTPRLTGEYLTEFSSLLLSSYPSGGIKHRPSLELSDVRLSSCRTG